MATKKKKKAAADIPPGSLAFVCDPHIDNHPHFGGPLIDGINSRGWQTLRTFEAAVQKALALKCAGLVVPGDLFHRSKPDPAIVAQVQKILANAGDLGVLLIPGNHDMLDATATGGNTAMAPLWDYATIVSEPQWFSVGGFSLLAIPFDARGFMSETLKGVLAKRLELSNYDPKGLHVMATHVGIWDGNAEFWQARAKDGMNVEDLLTALGDLRWAFVGNYHEHHTWTRKGIQVNQVGTLCPHSFSDAGLEDRGLMAMLTPKGDTIELEIPGPRFIDTTETGLVKVGKPPQGFTYYVRQMGGDTPTANPKDRGWHALTHTPDKAGKAAGPGAGEQRQKLGVEEAIVAGVKAHKTLETDADRDTAAENALTIWRAIR